MYLGTLSLALIRDDVIVTVIALSQNLAMYPETQLSCLFLPISGITGVSFEHEGSP